MATAAVCGFAVSWTSHSRKRSQTACGHNRRRERLCMADHKDGNAPKPRRRRYRVHPKPFSAEDIGENVGEHSGGRGRFSAEDQRRVEKVLREADLSDLDPSFVKQLRFLLYRLVGEELALMVFELGSWLVCSARLALGRLVNLNVEEELVISEQEPVDVEYGVAGPNKQDKYFVDPLVDWQLTDVNYYLDSCGNKVQVSMCTAAPVCDFLDFVQGEDVETGDENEAKEEQQADSAEN
mmetsp:Transcript_362/g.1221  ORF Transcript_362/g.1221 Transcript_362/m.1221 type:complete len:238 (-) Transcript_362:70-783(-)